MKHILVIFSALSLFASSESATDNNKKSEKNQKLNSITKDGLKQILLLPRRNGAKEDLMVYKLTDRQDGFQDLTPLDKNQIAQRMKLLRKQESNPMPVHKRKAFRDIRYDVFNPMEENFKGITDRKLERNIVAAFVTGFSNLKKEKKKPYDRISAYSDKHSSQRLKLFRDNGNGVFTPMEDESNVSKGKIVTASNTISPRRRSSKNQMAAQRRQLGDLRHDVYTPMKKEYNMKEGNQVKQTNWVSPRSRNYNRKNQNRQPSSIIIKFDSPIGNNRGKSRKSFIIKFDSKKEKLKSYDTGLGAATWPESSHRVRRSSEKNQRREYFRDRGYSYFTPMLLDSRRYNRRNEEAVEAMESSFVGQQRRNNYLGGNTRAKNARALYFGPPSQVYFEPYEDGTVCPSYLPQEYCNIYKDVNRRGDKIYSMQ